MRPALLSILLAISLACTTSTPEQFDPEAIYIGGDRTCAEFADMLPNLRQSAAFDDEVRENVEFMLDLSEHSEPAIRRAVENFSRSLRPDGQMALQGAIEEMREACVEAEYIE